MDLDCELDMPRLLSQLLSCVLPSAMSHAACFGSLTDLRRSNCDRANSSVSRRSAWSGTTRAALTTSRYSCSASRLRMKDRRLRVGGAAIFLCAKMGCVGSSPKAMNPLKVDQSHFEVYRVLGRGAFGKVNAVRHLGSGELMAMKSAFKDVVLKSKSDNVIWQERVIMASVK